MKKRKNKIIFNLTSIGKIIKSLAKNLGNWLKLSLRNPKKIYASNSLLLVVLVLGILIIINLIAVKENLSLDTTKNQRFTLSSQTLNLLKGLKDQIKVTAFLEEGSDDKNLLKTYQNQSYGKLAVEFINPDQKPGLAKQYGVTRYGTVFFNLGERKEIVTNINESEYSAAILRLIHRETNKIYFLTGHGEKSLSDDSEIGYSALKSNLEQNGFTTNELNLSNQKNVTLPDDISVLVIAGPQNQLFNQETEAIKKYLTDGGKVFVMLDPDLKNQVASYGLAGILGDWGISVKNGLIIDPQSGLFGDPATPTVQQYDAHQITQNLAYTFYPGAISVSKKDLSGYTITELAKTSEDSWLETDLSNQQVSFDPNKDIKGPINVIVTSQKTDTQEKQNQGRLEVVGDSDLLDNAYYQALANQDLFINSLRWLLAQEELMNITPKEQIDNSVYLTTSQAKTIFWSTVVVIPVIFILIGVGIWYTRKIKKLA